MNIKLKRYTDSIDSTGGLLFVNGSFYCFTCEDQYQTKKVYGETRIPEGTYEIKLRDAGGMNERYKKRYPFHKGMLHLQGVPNFTWIYIHPGNNDDHTEGCILVGLSSFYFNNETTISSSVEAYENLYKELIKHFEHGEKVFIEIIDISNCKNVVNS